MTLDQDLVALIITAIIGPALLVGLGWRRDQQKARASAEKEIASAQRDKAEGDATIVGSTLRWAHRLEQQVGALDARVRELAAANDRLRLHNVLLSAQVIDLGGKPVPPPDLGD